MHICKLDKIPYQIKKNETFSSRELKIKYIELVLKNGLGMGKTGHH